jgi:tellurite resistance protein TehA-like permease
MANALWILLFLFILSALIESAQSLAERAVFCGVFGISLLGSLRYFLPVCAAPLWWLQVACIAMVLVAAVLLLAEINREARALAATA